MRKYWMKLYTLVTREDERLKCGSDRGSDAGGVGSVLT
jgi:hypothetical protein